MEHNGGVPEPYRLRAVAHSLGGASLLVYAVMCRRLGRPHHLYRIILLTPAGFLEKIPLVRAQLLPSTLFHLIPAWPSCCQTLSLLLSEHSCLSQPLCQYLGRA